VSAVSKVFRPFRRIGFRIFATFAALLASLTAAFFAVGFDFAEKTIHDNAGNELRLLSVILSRQVQRHLSRMQESLTAVSYHQTVVQEMRRRVPDAAVLSEVLETRLKAMPFFEELAIFNKAGAPVASTDEHWLDIQAARQPFFVNGMKAFNFAGIFTSDEGKIQLVSAPVLSGSSAKGVVVAQVNMASIYDLMDQKLGVSETTDAFLLDGELRFITPGKTGEDKLLQSHLIATPLQKRLKEEFWVDSYSNYFGEQVLGTAMKVPGRSWYVVVERGIDEIKRPVAAVKRALLAAAASLLLVLLLITLLLTRSITKPLNELLAGVRRIAEGDLKAPFLIPRGVDELSFLAGEFDKMRGKVAEFQGKLMEKLEASERKRLESQRLAAIGTLASTLAHEIRNPLNAMNLLVSRLELSRAAVGSTSDGVLRDLRGEIARLDRLVSDILDYSKPLSLKLEAVPLKPLIDSTLEVYRGLFDERRLACSVAMPEGPLAIRGDPDKLKQCLVNVLQNAVEAVSSGGRIEIEAAAFEQSVEIIVRDDGVGIPAESASRLFDLFYTTKERGTGLGLSTVKKIVDAHGGAISIARRLAASGDTYPATGTEVRIVFPVDSQV
jgi:signal transduction histidine kinase